MAAAFWLRPWRRLAAALAASLAWRPWLRPYVPAASLGCWLLAGFARRPGCVRPRLRRPWLPSQASPGCRPCVQFFFLSHPRSQTLLHPAALMDRRSFIKAALCLAHQTANNRISFAVPVTARRHQIASSVRTIWDRDPGSKNFAVCGSLAEICEQFFHPSAHGCFVAGIAFGVVLITIPFNSLFIVPQPRRLLPSAADSMRQSFLSSKYRDNKQSVRRRHARVEAGEVPALEPCHPHAALNLRMYSAGTPERKCARCTAGSFGHFSSSPAFSDQAIRRRPGERVLSGARNPNLARRIYRFNLTPWQIPRHQIPTGSANPAGPSDGCRHAPLTTTSARLRRCGIFSGFPVRSDTARSRRRTCWPSSGLRSSSHSASPAHLISATLIFRRPFGVKLANRPRRLGGDRRRRLCSWFQQSADPVSEIRRCVGVRVSASSRSSNRATSDARSFRVDLGICRCCKTWHRSGARAGMVAALSPTASACEERQEHVAATPTARAFAACARAATEGALLPKNGLRLASAVLKDHALAQVRHGA